MVNKGTKRRPTMQDVARMAGVSQTTVSFVINETPDGGISEDTRDRVWQAVETLGYRPNAVARELRRSRSHTIGFLTDAIATTPYAGQIIAGAQDAAWALGKILMIVNTGLNAPLREAGLELMLERQVEGVIYASMYHRAVEPLPDLRDTPALLLDCYVEDRSLPSVVPDEVGGGRDATDVLLHAGHRRIGFINLCPPHMLPAATGRLSGYQAALAAHGIPFDPQLVCSGDSTAESGYQCTRELMELPDPPTALFCGVDRMAMGAYDALRDLGLRIPDDVAVVGFDNQEVIAAHLRPPLSTMQLPHYEMGQWAVQFLIEQMAYHHVLPPIQHTMPCPYVERASV
jgi:LacI family transcriptional regulator